MPLIVDTKFRDSMRKPLGPKYLRSKYLQKDFLALIYIVEQSHIKKEDLKMKNLVVRRLICFCVSGKRKWNHIQLSLGLGACTHKKTTTNIVKTPDD
jgi:hypothetical protein